MGYNVKAVFSRVNTMTETMVIYAHTLLKLVNITVILNIDALYCSLHQQNTVSKELASLPANFMSEYMHLYGEWMSVNKG